MTETLARAPKVFYGWRIVGVLAVTETVSWGILYYAFAVFLVPMQRDLGLSAAVVSGAFSTSVLVAGLSAVIVGRWLDRHGARGLMTSGSVAAALLVVAWSQVRTGWQLYLVFAAIGAVSAMVLYEPAFAVLVRWFEQHRGRALLAVTVVAGFASTVFVPTAAYLEAAIGWRDALLVLALVLAATTVLPHALVLRRDPGDLGLGPDGRADPRRPAPVRTSARQAVTGSGFRWLTIAFAANALVVVVVAVHLFPFLREHGHSVAFAAGTTGALGVLSVTGRLVVTGLVSRLPLGQVTAAMFAVQGLAAVVLLLAPSSAVAAAVFVALFGLGFGVGTIARPAMVAARYGTDQYATLSALIGLALTAARVAGPVLAGVVRTVTGSYTLVLLGVAVAGLVGSAALLAADSRTPG